MTIVSGSDALGLTGLLPGPGWVILDAARDQRFTGELVAFADEEIRVYFDRGRIYVAERASDPPLGTRLVDAGALNRAQLEYGTMKIGPIEHLGRLFDRVPSVNRDGVLVINELMTEQCIRWLAAQPLQSVVVTPYRHHESGMHRWEAVEPAGSTTIGGIPPEMALPAPPADATPVIAAEPGETPEPTTPATPRTQTERSSVADTTSVEAPPETAAPPAAGPAAGPTAGPGDVLSTPRFGPMGDPLVDDVVEWDEPSSLDPAGRAGRGPRPGAAAHPTRDLLADARSDDWIDALDHSGVADAPTASAREHLTPLEVRRPNEFELIWPSGETDDLTDEAIVDAPDHDRVSPAARVATAPPLDRRSESGASDVGRSDDRDAGRTDTISDIDDAPPFGPEDRRTPGRSAAPDTTDGTETTLAVRRAVATIDTGSLDARRRLAATPPPGRLVVERDHHLWRTGNERVRTSVFDEQPVEAPEPTPEPPTPSEDHEGRSGALRRLISSLRRA